MTSGERRIDTSGERRIDIDAAGRGFGQLVVVVLDVVRQLLERQAVRRLESGTLTDEEIERVGRALQALEEQLTELRDAFGTTADDRTAVRHPPSTERIGEQ